jgi:hypothetical protein
MKQRYNKTAVVINVVINTDNANLTPHIVLTNKSDSDAIQLVIKQLLNALTHPKTGASG